MSVLCLLTSEAVQPVTTRRTVEGNGYPVHTFNILYLHDTAFNLLIKILCLLSLVAVEVQLALEQ